MVHLRTLYPCGITALHRFNQQLEVYRQEQGQLVLVETLAETERLTSLLFANFSLSVFQIFA